MVLMHIVEKLNLQVDSLLNDIQILKDEKESLMHDIKVLNDLNDKLKTNNENMLLNIDKALQHISNIKQQGVGDDISYQS
jgi:predicted  nucleic acid-binding Zn-ribbon protein